MRHKRKAWRDSTVKEWSKVAMEARKAHRTVCFARLFGICVLKHSELPVGDTRRKYTYRVVFGGNNVIDESWGAVQFIDLGSSPSSMSAGKFLDFYSCLPGNDGQQADAQQAYLQTDYTGTETWIRLPEEAWLPEWYDEDGAPLYQNPVVLMEKAIYGHPDSGSLWEKHCDDILVKKIRFHHIQGWDSCYYHPETKLLLSVYVDDFKLAGPRGKLSGMWDRLRKFVDLDPPEPFGQFLGCAHKRFKARVSPADLPGAEENASKEKVPVIGIEYDMQG